MFFETIYSFLMNVLPKTKCKCSILIFCCLETVAKNLATVYSKLCFKQDCVFSSENYSKLCSTFFSFEFFRIFTEFRQQKFIKFIKEIKAGGKCFSDFILSQVLLF